MNIWEFVRSKQFFRHLLYALAAAVVIMWVSLKLLDIYTHHGRTIAVPDLHGMFEPEVKEVISQSRLRYVINDSIFHDEGEKGSIYTQDPAPGTEVKRGRMIYLTMIATMPEMVAMPDLTDLSLRQAISLLLAHGLRPGSLEYRPDIARNAVLQQKFNMGPIEPGTPVAKGTIIDLVLGEGLGENVVEVPILLGFSREEAIQALHAATLNVGNEFFVDEDQPKTNVRVYQQQPNPLQRKHYLQAGSSVDLYFRSPEVFDFETYLAEQLTVPVPMLYGKTPEEARQLIESLGLETGDEVFEGNTNESNAWVYAQDPDYEEGVMITKGTTINLWYRSIEAFGLDIFDNEDR